MTKIAQTTLTMVAELLIASNQMLAVSESCTGGWLAKVCTDLPGSSRWFERGFVTYSNEAKAELLGVSEQTLTNYGAVSEQTVCEMTAGTLKHSHADWSIAISGVAGPDGGTDTNPVGSVWFAWQQQGAEPLSKKALFTGERHHIREQSVEFALSELHKLLK